VLRLWPLGGAIVALSTDLPVEQPTFPLLVESVTAYLKEPTPSLGWLASVLLANPVDNFDFSTQNK